MSENRFELSGVLKVVYPTQKVSEKFQKREFVLECNLSSGGYQSTELIKFQASQERCNFLDEYKEGDKIKVLFNIRGKRWEKDGKESYFTNLDVYRIEAESKTPYDEVPPPDDFDMDSQYNDDVPF